MSTNYTNHLGLSLWSADDPVLRTEFNANHTKLDAAIAALTAAHGCVSGTYEGGVSPDRVTIDVGFEPSLAIIMCDHPDSNNGSDVMCLLAIKGACLRVKYASSDVTFTNILTDSGVLFSERSSDKYGLNNSGTTYRYALFH